MKKIFISTPYSSDANSFWRCMGPMSYMAKHSGGEISIYLPPNGVQIQWDRLAEFDLIFLHRPCRREDVVLMRMAKLLNIPVWSDYDDWLFHLPAWNPSVLIYHNPEVQENMALCIATTDILSVSSIALQTEFQKINPNTVLIPNAYRSDLYPFRQSEVPERNPVFVWRGTNTHDGDLLSVASAFPKLSHKTQFLGGPAYSVLCQMNAEKYEKIDPVDPMIYWRAIYQRAPKAWLNPLDDCFFNRCKSNISWIEAIHSGAVCVAPNLPEWRQPGVITYEPGDADEFLSAAEYAIEMDPQSQNAIVSEAYDYILSKYDISVINTIRTAVFESVFQPSFKRNHRDPFQQLTGIWALNILKGQPQGQSNERND
jgi:hypothetical protein